MTAIVVGGAVETKRIACSHLAKHCDFCGQGLSEMMKMFVGNASNRNVFICDECVVHCVSLFAGRKLAL